MSLFYTTGKAIHIKSENIKHYNTNMIKLITSIQYNYRRLQFDFTNSRIGIVCIIYTIDNIIFPIL